MTTAAGRTLVVGEIRDTVAGLCDDVPVTVDGKPVLEIGFTDQATDSPRGGGISALNLITDSPDVIASLIEALEQIQTGNHTKAQMIKLAEEALS